MVSVGKLRLRVADPRDHARLAARFAAHPAGERGRDLTGAGHRLPVVVGRGDRHQQHPVVRTCHLQHSRLDVPAQQVEYGLADNLPGTGHRDVGQPDHHDRVGRFGRRQALLGQLPGRRLAHLRVRGEQMGEHARRETAVKLLFVQQQPGMAAEALDQLDVGAVQPPHIVDEEEETEQPAPEAHRDAQPAEDSQLRMAGYPQRRAGLHDAELAEPVLDLRAGLAHQDRVPADLVDGPVLRGVDDHALLMVFEHHRSADTPGQLLDESLEFVQGHDRSAICVKG